MIMAKDRKVSENTELFIWRRKLIGNFNNKFKTVNKFKRVYTKLFGLIKWIQSLAVHRMKKAPFIPDRHTFEFLKTGKKKVFTGDRRITISNDVMMNFVAALMIIPILSSSGRSTPTFYVVYRNTGGAKVQSIIYICVIQQFCFICCHRYKLCI